MSGGDKNDERERFHQWTAQNGWHPTESMWAAWEARAALSARGDTVAVPREQLVKWESWARVRGEELSPSKDRPGFLSDGLADQIKDALALSHVATPKCESCGYVESHDANCPRPMDLQSLIARLDDAIQDTFASGRPAGNLDNTWDELRKHLAAPSSEVPINAAPQPAVADTMDRSVLDEAPSPEGEPKRTHSGEAVGAAPIRLDSLESAFARAINGHSVENASGTPDFILAKFLGDVLLAWNRATKEREHWYWDTAQQQDCLLSADEVLHWMNRIYRDLNPTGVIRELVSEIIARSHELPKGETDEGLCSHGRPYAAKCSDCDALVVPSVTTHPPFVTLAPSSIGAPLGWIEEDMVRWLKSGNAPLGCVVNLYGQEKDDISVGKRVPVYLAQPSAIAPTMPLEIEELLAALQDYAQADEKGVMVNVSRQACDEAARVIRSRYWPHATSDGRSET